jgi:hypothetical protein
MEAIDFPKAALLYREEWITSAYTSLLMLKKLLELTETSLKTYIEKPQTLEQNKAAVNKAIKEATFDQLKDLWQTATGTCTAWAINLAEALTGSPEGLIIGDLGNHRLAWSENGVVLDSSAQMAINLECHNQKGSWKVERGIGSPKLFFQACSFDT